MRLLKMISVSKHVPTKMLRVTLTDLGTLLISLVQESILEKCIKSKKEIKSRRFLMDEAAGKPLVTKR